MSGRRRFRLRTGQSLPITPVFDMLWRFAFERQEVLNRRVRGLAPPWTTDPVIGAYRFTNAYRAADRASQFLIRSVIYGDSRSWRDVFFRVILFRLFNRVDTWRLVESQCGTPLASNFNVREYDSVLSEAFTSGRRLYSSAYIMPAPPFGALRKHTNHLRLLEWMMMTRVDSAVAKAGSLSEVYRILLGCPSLGPFLAFQYAIDLNYSDHLAHSEMECVVAGPGARSGLRKAFADRGGLSDEELICEVADASSREFAERGLRFRELSGRPLQLIDVQNLFCEVDKYSRVAAPEIEGEGGRTRLKRRFTPAGTIPPPWYPPKWRVDTSAGQSASAR